MGITDKNNELNFAKNEAVQKNQKMDVANQERPGLAPEFLEFSNLSTRTLSKDFFAEAGGISFSRLSRWGIEGKITN